MTAIRASLASTTTTLATSDRTLQLDVSGGNHTTTLPGVVAASGLDFVIQKISTGSNTITLALAGGDSGAKIYYGSNTPVAGTSLTLSDSSLTTRPSWFLVSDGVNWWVS